MQLSNITSIFNKDSANIRPLEDTVKGKDNAKIKDINPLQLLTPSLNSPSTSILEGKSNLKIEKAETDKIISERLKNPDFEIVDRGLIRIYLALKDKTTAKKLIRNRLVQLMNEKLSRYTGREDNAKRDKGLSALQYVVYGINIFNDKEIHEINVEANKGILSPSEQALIDTLRAHPKSEKAREDVLQKIREYSYYWEGSIWGTKARVDLYRNMTAFSALAGDAGIDPEDIQSAGMLDTELYPKADKFMEILEAYCAADTPEKSDDKEFRPKILEDLRNSIKELYNYFNRKQVDVRTLDSLLFAYRIYEDLARRLGIPGPEILKIENEIKSRLTVKPDVTAGATQILTPDGLPKETLRLLKNTEIRSGYTYYQFLKENVQYIILSKEKERLMSVGAMVGGEAGGGYIADGVIHINDSEYDLKNDLPEDVHLFDVILHEAHHAFERRIWLENNSGSFSTMKKEGDSYGFESQALKNAESKLSPQILNKVHDEIDYDDAMLKSSMMIYDMKDLLSIALNEKDMDIYPSNTPYYQAYTYLSSLKKAGLIKSDQERYFVRVLSDVFMDKIDLEKAPERLKNLIRSLLVKIDPSYGKMEYSKALAVFKYKLKTVFNDKKFYGLEMIQNLNSYSVDYKIPSSMRGKVKIYNDQGRSIGIVPDNKKIKLVIDHTAWMNEQGFVKVSYENIKGYVNEDYLVDYLSDQP